MKIKGLEQSERLSLHKCGQRDSIDTSCSRRSLLQVPHSTRDP